MDFLDGFIGFVIFPVMSFYRKVAVQLFSAIGIDAAALIHAHVAWHVEARFLHQIINDADNGDILYEFFLGSDKGKSILLEAQHVEFVSNL